MGTVNSANYKVDQTVRLFDQFYDYDVNVSAQEYDAVSSFFKSIYTDPQAADNFTISLFRVSEQSKIPVMTLLQEIQGQDQAQLTLTLAYYLNGIRSPSTLLGLNASVTPNYYVARNVRS